MQISLVMSNLSYERHIADTFDDSFSVISHDHLRHPACKAKHLAWRGRGDGSFVLKKPMLGFFCADKRTVPLTGFFNEVSPVVANEAMKMLRG